MQAVGIQLLSKGTGSFWQIPHDVAPLGSFRRPLGLWGRDGQAAFCPDSLILAAVAGGIYRRRLHWQRGRLTGKSVRRAGPQLGDAEIQSALHLPPHCLHIVPSSEACGAELSGDWLPLFRASAPYVAMFCRSIMVFHLPGRLLDGSRSGELAGLLEDIVLCKLLGVQPVLVIALEDQVKARLSAENLCGGQTGDVSTPGWE